ncbi:MAG TPA: hypothetical protein VHF47_01900 [Acidimicrobiales bacterium]|nr:hypothetical protein [Acidimicrobiales bacterium]
MRDLLPRGDALPPEAWRHRHRGIVVLLWLHVPTLFAYGAIRGVDPLHGLQEAAVVAAFAVLATRRQASENLRMLTATLGLMTSSGVLVHLSGGTIEAHFHFFVMVAVISLYQTWPPFLLAVGYVVVHHGLVGALDADAVFNHPAALRQPWLWAGVHGLFILGESVALLTTWRLSEGERDRTADVALQLQATELAQRQALEINDAVVQGLTVSRYALDTGDPALASAALDSTLDAARDLVSRLLHETSEDGRFRAGDLVREVPAIVLPQREPL